MIFIPDLMIEMLLQVFYQLIMIKEANPTSRHNTNQVRTPRLDKDGVPIEGRDRVCLDLSWVNKMFEPFKHHIPDIQELFRC